MKTKITNAKIACLDMNLQKARMHLGVHITVDDPEKLEDIRKRYIFIYTLYNIVCDLFIYSFIIVRLPLLLNAFKKFSLQEQMLFLQRKVLMTFA
jgi:hypothetical protein